MSEIVRVGLELHMALVKVKDIEVCIAYGVSGVLT